MTEAGYAPQPMGRAQAYVVNTDVGVGEVGEIVHADPVLWASFIEAGYLSPVDEDGNRFIELNDNGSE